MGTKPVSVRTRSRFCLLTRKEKEGESFYQGPGSELWHAGNGCEGLGRGLLVKMWEGCRETRGDDEEACSKEWWGMASTPKPKVAR